MNDTSLPRSVVLPLPQAAGPEPFAPFAPDVFCTLDRQGRFVSVGAAALGAWGYEPEALRGTGLLSLIDDAGRPGAERQLQAARGTADAVRFACHLRKKEGGFTALLWSVRWNPDQQVWSGVARKSSEAGAPEQPLLQGGNSHLLGALEWMSDGFCTTGPDWTITYMNKRAANMLNITEEGRYVGKKLWACFPQAVGTRFYTEYHRAAAENTFVLVEEYYPPLKAWFEVNIYPHAAGLSFFIKDITVRKQQEQRLEFIAKATSELIWERAIDSEEVFLDTAKLRELTGYELRGPSMPRSFWIDKIHPDDKALVEENRKKGTRKETDFYFDEHRFRKADGTWAYIKNRIFVVRDGKGCPVSLLGAAEDITAQRLYEKALIESEERYRLLFDHAPLPTVILDAATLQVLEANEALVEQYGYSRAELRSMTVLDLHGVEEHGRVRAATEQVLSCDFKEAGVFHHLTKNGGRLKVEVSVTPIHYGGRAAVLATAQDITEKVRLQQQLVQEKVDHQKRIHLAALEAQERERNQIGTELHDNVNQILAAAKLYVENIRYMAEQQDYFLDRSVALLNGAIGEIRRLSHALATPTLRDGGLGENLLALAETFRELHAFAVHTVFDFGEAQLPPGLQLTIYRILQECFTNTVKYARASEVVVHLWQQGQALEVRYSDNGRSFVPAAATKGIGLQNITGRAEAHGGVVTIAPTPTGGFALSASFPLPAA